MGARKREGRREEKDEDKDRWGAKENRRFSEKANPEGISKAFQAIYTMHLQVFLGIDNHYLTQLNTQTSADTVVLAWRQKCPRNV